MTWKSRVILNDHFSEFSYQDIHTICDQAAPYRQLLYGRVWALCRLHVGRLAVAVCPGVGPMPRIADFMITGHGLYGLRVPYSLGGWSRVAGRCVAGPWFARGRCRLQYGRPIRKYRIRGGFVDDHWITKGRRVLTQAIRPALSIYEKMKEKVNDHRGIRARFTGLILHSSYHSTTSAAPSNPLVLSF